MKRAKVKATYDKRSSHFGFAEWSLLDQEGIPELINKIIEHGCKIAMESDEYQCSAWFPMEYYPSDGVSRQKPPQDPTTIFVELPLGPDDDNSPRWSFTLTELIASAIDFVEQGESGPIAEKDHPPLIAIRDSLRQLADTLDAALQREQGQK